MPPVTRLAWFSPMPPSASGIAAYSQELLPALASAELQIDVFVDDRQGAAPGTRLFPAQDFVWRHRRQPYDLTIYQLGNAACHDYMWGYLFRYPGLVILHDAQIHQARAQSLLAGWQPRRDDYLAEFAANHPDAPADAGRLVAAGLGGTLFGLWPHVRLVLQAARLSAVHSEGLAQRLAAAHDVDVRTVPMGVTDPLATTALTRDAVRTRHGMAPDDVVVGAFGGLTPEKRLPQLLEAVAALASTHPQLRVLLVGAQARHYDVMADASARGIADRVHLTGYVPDDGLPAHLAAADLCACLRWPTNGETSASWLRAMAAGRPTLVTDLAHQGDLPVANPWGTVSGGEPVAVAIPILDEANALKAALASLIADPARRTRLATAARAWWRERHTLEAMASGYRQLIAEALTRPAGAATLPAHLVADGDERLAGLLAPFDVAMPAGVAD